MPTFRHREVRNRKPQPGMYSGAEDRLFVLPHKGDDVRSAETRPIDGIMTV